MNEKPIEQIEKKLIDGIPKSSIEFLPNKWEKTGDVLTIVLPKKLEEYKEKIGGIYSLVLGCKTVLNDIGGISGEYRKPNVEIIYGSDITETVHKENGVRYKLDPQKIMFSSGNMDERIRMGSISKPGEIVVDLFAGIGYFTLPIAVHCKPVKVIAVEKNPVSYDYLCKNVTLNNVIDIVEPILGDNRNVAPKDIADRIIMGYFGDTYKFLDLAFSCLKNCCGTIHYHDTFAEETAPEEPMNRVEKIADKYDRCARLLTYKNVKSYAPGINHYVFDIKVGEK